MITRAELQGELALSPTSPTKTFVLEAHVDDSHDYLSALFGHDNLVRTEDAYLYKVLVDDGVFWVDQLDERFWNIHTDMPAQMASDRIRHEVETRRELDWMWLPSGHLKNIWPNSETRRVNAAFRGGGLVGVDAAASDLRVRLSGRNASDLLEYIADNPRYKSSVPFESVQTSITDSDLGFINEGVNRRGMFAVSGDSFEFHAQFVSTVVQRYKTLVQLCERKSLGFESFEEGSGDGGGRLNGAPISIRFSRAIENLQEFLTKLFSSRRPYRLWGVPDIYDDYAEVEAVDLHVGHRLRFDVGREWMRIYLEADCCGNTVARLVANLQHTFDSALEFADPELQAALMPNEQPLAIS